MNLFFIAIVLLRLSFAIAANFTQVYQWNEFDYKWPSEAKKSQALRAGTFNPAYIEPRYMAVYGTRIFLSIGKHDKDLPVSLVSLPTMSIASSASPQLTPVPSWDAHGKGDCNKIEKAKGLQMDSVGRLWLLDQGSYNCNAKLWTIDLYNNDRTRLLHQLSFRSFTHDLVLDETSNGTFAYISRWGEQHIVVFSLERNRSWTVYTAGIAVVSIALSPKVEPRELYLSKYDSNELYSISVATLRNGTRTVNPKLIGKWTALSSYRMLMDNRGTMYAAFSWNNYISSFNTSQTLSTEQQRFYEVGELDTRWPFTFALDTSGNFWITVFNDKRNKPKCRLLRAAVGAKPYTSDSPTTEVSNFKFTTATPNNTCINVGKMETGQSTNSALIGSLAFFLVLSCIINLWFILRTRKLQNSNEQRNAGAEEMEMSTLTNPVSPEMVHEEIENDLYGVVTAPPPRPRF